MASTSIDDGAVAQYLLNKRYFLVALELHQELLEGNNGVHNVASLNSFFNSPEQMAALVRSTEDKAKQNKSSALGNGMASIDSPFANDGLQPAIAARDQKIALLEYKVRCLEADVGEAHKQLEEARAGTSAAIAGATATAAAGSATPGGTSGQGASSSALASIAAWLGSDEEGSPVSHHERRTLNALVRRYLLSRGYKQAAVSFAEEVTDQDLGPTADDSELLALPGARRRGGGSGAAGGPGSAPVLSLLAMHRKRIAPIQALAESEARNDSAVAALRSDLKTATAELEAAHGELAASRERLAGVEADLAAARATATAAAKAGPGALAPGATSGAAAPSANAPPSSALPAAIVPVAVPGGKAGGVALAHAPALLRALEEGLPALVPHVVTRHRGALIPILAAAAGAEGTLEGRRGLLQRLLTLIRRPSHAERCLVRAQVAALAGKLGPAAVESEVLPEVILLSKTGKTKERKALAAALAGALAPFVSDKRCDGLLATLTDLSESPHAIVRVGVVEGLTSLASTVADRWARAVASGSVQGSSTAIEAFSLRQFASVEELMWRCLLGAGGGGTEDNDAAELEAAAAAEFPLAISPALALMGVPSQQPGQAHGGQAPPAGSAPASSGSSKPGSAGTSGKDKEGAHSSLPASWGIIPPTVASAVCSSLVPVMVGWAYRLGSLWTRFLPGLLTQLAETLHASPNGGSGPNGPSSGSSGSGSGSHGGHHAGANGPNGGGAYGSGPAAAAMAALIAATGLGSGKAASSVRLTEWHQRRVALILSVLTASASRVRSAVFDEGYSIEMLAAAAASAAGAAAAPGSSRDAGSATSPSAAGGAASAGGTATNGDSAFAYELFDFSSQAAITGFPPAEAIVALPGMTGAPPPAMPPQQRQALVLTAVLRGTVAVRRRRVHAPGTALPAGTPPVTWQPVRDEFVSVSWPALRFVLRSLLPVLVRQAACVNRSSHAGRGIVDAYAGALCGLGVAFGPAFTSLALRPMFLRAFGVPCELPPPPPPTPAGAGPGRKPCLVVLSQVLYGLPTPAKYAAPSQGGAGGASALPAVNCTHAGPSGGEWPLVLPELAWLSRDSTDNPSNWNKTPAQIAAAAQAAAQASAAAGAGKAGEPPSAASINASTGPSTGGSWNADSLLPLFGSGVLACPALAPTEHIEHALRALIVMVATGRAGWGGAGSALEDCVLRAGGGNSRTLASAAAAAASGGKAAPAPLSPRGAAAAGGDDHSHASSSSPSSSVLQFMLTDVLARASAASDGAIRGTVAGLYRSLVPLLSPAQLRDPFLPTIRRLTTDKDPGVVKAAVRALATVYSSPAATSDEGVRGDVNGEVARLLGAGPKEVIVEILRALMRAVPTAPPALRDEFILDRLLETSQGVTAAANAGAEAMREVAAQFGGDVLGGGDDGLHAAAKDAVKKARAAAMQGVEPWPGAQPEELEEVAMALAECFRAFGSCVLAPDTADILRQEAEALCDSELLEPTYRDMMRGTFAAMFPRDSDRVQGQQGGGGYGDGGHGDHDDPHHGPSGSAGSAPAGVSSFMGIDRDADLGSFAHLHGGDDHGGGGALGRRSGFHIPGMASVDMGMASLAESTSKSLASMFSGGGGGGGAGGGAGGSGTARGSSGAGTSSGTSAMSMSMSSTGGLLGKLGVGGLGLRSSTSADADHTAQAATAQQPAGHRGARRDSVTGPSDGGAMSMSAFASGGGSGAPEAPAMSLSSFSGGGGAGGGAPEPPALSMSAFSSGGGGSGGGGAPPAGSRRPPPHAPPAHDHDSLAEEGSSSGSHHGGSADSGVGAKLASGWSKMAKGSLSMMDKVKKAALE